MRANGAELVICSLLVLRCTQKNPGLTQVLAVVAAAVMAVSLHCVQSTAGDSCDATATIAGVLTNTPCPIGREPRGTTGPIPKSHLPPGTIAGTDFVSVRVQSGDRHDSHLNRGRQSYRKVLPMTEVGLEALAREEEGELERTQEQQV